MRSRWGEAVETAPPPRRTPRHRYHIRAAWRARVIPGDEQVLESVPELEATYWDRSGKRSAVAILPHTYDEPNAGAGVVETIRRQEL